ncbi:phage tail protein [Methylobacterium sp. AMS5]|uniref:TipJ family phage tail tip protein n=1 Tax=Methylobacterium sp. AMS5 TaxID=925818 RepID=UPI00074FA86C|nr:phage tail protein [Methylobacterium sp. AMS5]AMB48254.1 hypothetical protein Y590_25135 [Methylobacterium sp. AMS5]
MTDDVRALTSVSTDIHGSGGLMGGGGKGGSKKGSDAANTLRSNAKARVVELLGEGEIVGLVDGAKSIYFDATPLLNTDGSANFTGVTWQQRVGLPDQEALSGFPQTETPYQVNVEVKQKQEPPIRTIADRNATAFRVIMNIPSLLYQNQSTGNLQPASVDYVIEIRKHNSSQWDSIVRGLIFNQKTTSPYQKSHVVELPQDGFPWDIRVRRINADAPNEYEQSSTVWESYSVIVAGRFTYPNSALVALELDAENFGSSIPARYYDVKGLIVQVPDNYDPETRTYNGFWEGNFKRAWTNNPAWVLYDLLTANRYGLGEFVDASKIDKWGLYEIAQYCDQLVPDGFGGREPRFTFNSVINSRDEAFKVLQNVCTIFRGMAFWSLGQVFAVADSPRDVDKIFSPANVIGGQFNYSGTAKKARHSVAAVTWNDPNDFYRTAIELVQHDDALDRFGWRQTDIQAIGCTSRGQAYRYGKWTLDTEHTATETVDFECSIDALAKDPIKPGHIVAIADPRKAQVRLGGRVAANAGLRLTLDKAFEPVAGESYRISVMLPSGDLWTDEIQGWEQDNLVAVLAHQPPEQILPFANWAITGTDVAPRQYRVLSVREEKKNTFKIAALFHDPLKYARVEEEIILEPIRYTRPKATVKPPTNLKATESLYFKDGNPRSRISLSWTPGDDFMSARYAVNATTPEGEREYGQVSSTSIDIDDIRAGTYTFSLTAIGINNKLSVPATLTFEAKGWDGMAGPEIVDLQVKGGGSEFSGPDATLEWGVSWPEGTVPYEVDFLVRVFDLDTREVLSEWVAPTQTFTYTFAENLADGGPRRRFWVQIRARDMNGREGNPAALVVSNPAPDLIVPDLQTTTETIYAGYDRPADFDFRGVQIWQELDPDFDPLTTKPVYEGDNSLVALKAAKNTAYYIRIAGFDAFGKTDLNISPAYKVIVIDRIIDTVAPEIPTGLKLETGSELTADGTLQAFIKAVWDPAIAENFKTYQVEIAEADTEFLRDGGTETPSWERHGLKPATRYRVRVRALNGSAIESAWSLEAEITTPLNEVAPGPVTNFEVTTNFQTAGLTWTLPADKDLAFTEIWSSDDQAVSSTLLGRVAAPQDFTFDKNLSVGIKRLYWARTVNTSGLRSDFVGPISAVSPQLQKEEIANGILDQTKFARGLSLIGTYDGLPDPAGYDGPSIIANERDGKLYQLRNGKWELVVAEVNVDDIRGLITDEMIERIDAAKLAGQLTDDQLKAISANKLIGKIVAAQIESLGVNQLIGQLKASQLEAIEATKLIGQLSAAQLKAIEASKLIGQVVDAQIASVGAGKLAGQITRVQITDGAIASPQIQAGSIYGDRLVVDTITAREIAARTITANEIAVGTLTADVIAARTITGDKLAFRSIEAGNIAAGAITAYEIAAYSITATNIAANQIAAWHIVAGTITTQQLQAGGVHADRLVANSITAGQLAANSVTAAAISAGSIEARHIVAYSITAGQIAARTIGAENIVAGSLTGNEIRANSIHADRLIANSITAAQIAAGAIKTAQLDAGAVTADKIGVGLGAGNLLFGSDFTNNIAAWVANWWSDGVAATIARNTDWAPSTMGSAMVHRPGVPSYGSVADYVLRRRTQTGWDNRYPCEPNKRYEFTAYVSVHRCSAVVGLQFLNAAGQEVGIAWGNAITNNQANGPLSAWPRTGTFGVAPSTAVMMVPICRTSWTGGTDPYTFWTGLYLGNAQPNQSAYSVWSPNSSTVIDGGIVATNSLHAEKIIAGTISADRLIARSITADYIAYGTLTGNEIAANSIYADRIQIGGGASLTSWLSGPNNAEINGGKISANTIAANKLSIGARGLKISGLRMWCDKEAARVNWEAGWIGYTDDNGNPASTYVAGGSYVHGAYLYLYWEPFAGYLNVTSDFGTAFAGNRVLMATYDGYANLNSIYGATQIDGTTIRTGTILAAQIAAGQIQAGHIAAGQITAGHIGANQVTADKLGAGTITASSAIYIGSSRFSLDVPTRMMRVFNPNGVEVISIGNTGRFWGEDDNGRHGIIVRANDGRHVFQVDQNEAYIDAAFIRNLRVSRAMIDDAIINNAKIENGAITSAKIGYLEVDTANIKNGAVSQALAGSWGAGGAQVLGVAVRTNEAKLQIRGISNNNPNTNWGGTAAGYLHIYFNPNNDGSRRWIIATVAQNFWMDRFLNYYWGTTPIEVVHQPGAGYHSYTIESSTGQAEGMNLSIIELTK